MIEESSNKPTPPLPLVHLRWLWSATLVGAAAGAILWVAMVAFMLVLNRTAWLLHMHLFWIWGGMLLLCLCGSGVLLGQGIAGLVSWSFRTEDPDHGIARFSGAFGLSACASLATSCLFLIAWKILPHAAGFALAWPIAAASFHVLLLAVATPWFFFLKRARRLLAVDQGAIGTLLSLLVHEARVTVRSQVPRILIILHGNALGLSLWLSGLLKFLEFHRMQDGFISLLQLVVFFAINILHLWLARSAFLAHLRHRVAWHLSPHLGSFAQDLPKPPPEFLKLFHPSETLSRWIRLPWNFLAHPFHLIIDRWEDWSHDSDPAERLRKLLSQDVPGIALPLLLALLQIAVALVPLLTLR